MIAINHTSYVDWLPAALAVYQPHRRLRFMIKAEMQDVKIVDFLIRHQDDPGRPQRGRAAPTRLRWSGCGTASSSASIPEATISRSFELKEFKTGAARMALRGRRADHPADRLGRAPDVDQGPSAQAGPQRDPDHRRSSASPLRADRTASSRPTRRCGRR